MDLKRLPHENIAAALARWPLPERVVGKLKGEIGPGTDWNNVLAAAASWEIEGAVLSNLSAHFATAMPAEVLARVRARQRETRAWALAGSLRTVDLAASLEQAGIPVIVLKGPAVSLRAYGDASLRSFSDIDVLVAPAHLASARAFLLDRGFQRDFESELESQLIRDHHALEFSNGVVKVEVHGKLLSRHLRFHIDDDELWRTATMVPLGNGTIRILSPAVLLLYLAAHGTKHMWASVRWIADIANLADRLEMSDVTHAVALAHRTHTRRILAVALRLARDVLGTDISRYSPDALASEAETRGLIAEVRSQEAAMQPLSFRSRLLGVHPQLGVLLYWARCRERLIDRISCLATVAFVPTEKDGGTGPMAWLRRPLRLGASAVRRTLA